MMNWLLQHRVRGLWYDWRQKDDLLRAWRWTRYKYIGTAVKPRVWPWQHCSMMQLARTQYTNPAMLNEARSPHRGAKAQRAFWVKHRRALAVRLRGCVLEANHDRQHMLLMLRWTSQGYCVHHLWGTSTTAAAATAAPPGRPGALALHRRTHDVLARRAGRLSLRAKKRRT